MNTKQEILNDLRREVLLLEGFKGPLLTEQTSLGRMAQAFPNKVFPYAALHEFFCYNREEATASGGFIAAMLSLRPSGGTVVWVGSSQKYFPPALKGFGLPPHRVLFVNITRENDVSWAVLEALKCSSVAAVIGELPEIDLTASRRFQLTIEDTGVGCFMIRAKPRNLLTTAVSRWHIKPLHTKAEDGLPGLGHPRWQVNLLKARNGKPGTWDIEWSNGGFSYASKLAIIHKALQKQTG